MGAPLRYASARKQLALYLDDDVEVARARVEAQILAGSPIHQHPSIRLDSEHLIGAFTSSTGLKSIVTHLEVSARAFDAIDFASIEASLRQMFQTREPAQAVLVPTMVRDVVVGTVESVILNRLRVMRWQGLALLGYRFREGREDVVVTRVTDTQEQRRRMEEYGRQMASSSIFGGELAWLKVYAGHQLELMRVELDGAELETS
jgi:predicted GTPase